MAVKGASQALNKELRDVLEVLSIKTAHSDCWKKAGYSASMFAYLCLALSMSLVGSYVALSKPLAAAIPVLLLAWLRFGIGALAMGHWLKKPSDEAPLTTHTRTLLFWEAFLGNFLFTLCMMYGVSLTSAVTAGVIMAGIPACVAVMSWVFLKEPIALRTWLAVALAVVGIALFALAQSAQPPTPETPDIAHAHAHAHSSRAWLGYALLVAAVLCEAAYSVIGKKLTAQMGPKRITALINLWGLALTTPLGIYTALHFDFFSLSLCVWLLLVFYALAACVWSVWLWMNGLKTVPAAQGGVFTVLLPVSATLVGVLVLGESLSGAQWGAFALALLSVLLATLPAPARIARIS